MTQLAGKIAIVTGAARGIGYATARILCQRGAQVVMTGTQSEALERAAERIRAAGGKALAVCMDLSKEESIASMVSTTIERFGRIDILHNNAADLSATQRDLDIESMDLEVWDRAFNVNVRGTMLSCKYTLPHMARAARGCIINTASALGLNAASVQAAYAASKAAIIQMSRSIATSHGKRGIRCNAILPGLTRTEGAQENLPPVIWKIQESENLTPFVGEAEDIAHAVVFLASDEARYITGQALLVDGGANTHVAGFSQFNALGPPPG